MNPCVCSICEQIKWTGSAEGNEVRAEIEVVLVASVVVAEIEAANAIIAERAIIPKGISFWRYSRQFDLLIET